MQLRLHRHVQIRDTRLVWDGPEGGRMFWSDGVAYCRYIGLAWDGRWPTLRARICGTESNFSAIGKPEKRCS